MSRSHAVGAAGVAVRGRSRRPEQPLSRLPDVARPCPHPRSVIACVDQIGTAFEADFAATGFGKHMAIPMIRDRWSADMTEADARSLLEDCMRVLFYRDCRTINRVRPAGPRARRPACPGQECATLGTPALPKPGTALTPPARPPPPRPRS